MNSLGDHSTADAQNVSVAEGPNSATTGQPKLDAHVVRAGGGGSNRSPQNPCGGQSHSVTQARTAIAGSTSTTGRL